MKARTLISASRKEKSLATIKREQKVNETFLRKAETEYVPTTEFVKLAEERNRPSANIDTQVVAKYGPSALGILPKGYHYNKELGAGKYGTAYQICHSKLHCMALKIVEIGATKGPSKEDVLNEIDMQRIFAADHLAPAIVGESKTWTFKTKQFLGFKMARIDGTLSGLLKRKLIEKDSLDEITTSIFALLGLLIIAKKSHNDFHSENIAFRYVLDDNGILRMEMLLIDFDFATLKKANTRAELIQFGRTLQMDIEDAEESKNTVWKTNTMAVWRRVEKVLRNSLGIKDTSERALTRLQDLES